MGIFAEVFVFVPKIRWRQRYQWKPLRGYLFLSGKQAGDKDIRRNLCGDVYLEKKNKLMTKTFAGIFAGMFV